MTCHIPQYNGTNERRTLNAALRHNFFIIALIAAVLRFRGVAGLSAEIGYVLVVSP
jgi:hypothetical protein